MKKTVVGIVSALTLFWSTNSIAQSQNFYYKEMNHWIVEGVPNTKENNASCYTETRWSDGSRFQLIKNLVTGELYIWVQSMSWNMSDDPGSTFVARVNTHGRNGVIGGDLTYMVINKNTIVIPQIQADGFIQPFMSQNEMHIIMPGTVQNFALSLKGSTTAIQSMSDCIDASKRANLGKPQLNQSVPKGQDI